MEESDQTAAMGAGTEDAPKPEAQATGKRRANSAYSFATIDGKMVFDYGPVIGKLVFDPSKASATNRARAMNHGFKQRIVDAAALDADDKTGKVDPQAKFDEMRRVIEHLESGSEEWNLKAASREGAGPASFVTLALVHLGTYQGFDVSTADRANAFVKRLADHPKFKFGGQVGKARAWLEANSKQIREAIEVVRAKQAEAADTGTDPDAELAGLLG